MENRKHILHVMGSRGTRPVYGEEFQEFGGQTSCYIIKSGNYAMVIDCGTGLYQAKEILKDCDIIDVFLTHVHYDHILGLLDWSCFPKDSRVGFYAAFKNWFGSDTISEFFRKPFWPVQPWLGPLCEIPQDGTPCVLGNGIVVENYPAPHPDGASLLHIKLGDKRVCVMFDCEDPEGLPFEIVKDCDILLYDGMYENETYAEHVGWGHSTWQEGCRLANEAHPKKLLITHHDPNYTDEMLNDLEAKAKKLYSAASFARAGERFEI